MQVISADSAIAMFDFLGIQSMQEWIKSMITGFDPDSRILALGDKDLLEIIKVFQPPDCEPFFLREGEICTLTTYIPTSCVWQQHCLWRIKDYAMDFS